jgi:hypothetical protein
LVAVAAGVAMVVTVVIAASALPRGLAGAAALPIVLLLLLWTAALTQWPMP